MCPIKEDAMNCQTTIRLISVAWCAELLSGCMAVVIGNLDPDQYAKLFLLPPDRSAIYLYRQDGLEDTLLAPLLLDGEPAGETWPGSYLVWNVKPGIHVLETDGIN